jgi:hypothetical protein
MAFAVLLALTCKSNPTNWEAVNEATIEKNLAALESAGDIYARELASGDTNAAAQKAQAALLASPGVDTACIAADNSVWALFDNGILAGTGNLVTDTAQFTPARLPSAEKVGASAWYSWEPVPKLTLVVPSATESPISAQMGLVACKYFLDIMRWSMCDTFVDAEVTVDRVRSLLATCSGVLYWVGHGTLVRVPGYGDSVSGLLLGTVYDTRAMAKEAAGPILDDLLPTGKDKRCAIWWDKHLNHFAVVILPAFIRKYADFEAGSLTWPMTVVGLTACYGAYGNPGDLVQAFLDKGADVVWGYDWAVEQEWAAERDSLSFSDMADTCFPFEAWRKRPNECPYPYEGRKANLQVYGNEDVRLQSVTRVAKDGQLYRAATTSGQRHAVPPLTAIVSLLRLQPDDQHSEDSATDAIEVWYPGSGTGHFNTANDENAVVTWIDQKTGRDYWAANRYVGVGCQINVTRSTADFIHGTFSGTIGHWEMGQNPESVPPVQTLLLTDGCFKVTVLNASRSRGSREVAVPRPGSRIRALPELTNR